MIGPDTHIDCIRIMLIMGKNIYVDDDDVYHDDNDNGDDDDNDDEDDDDDDGAFL